MRSPLPLGYNSLCQPAWETPTVVSLFSVTHSRQSVLYHSQSPVCSLSLTVVSLFSVTHSRQSVLYHSQSSVCSVSLTVVSLFWMEYCASTGVLYNLRIIKAAASNKFEYLPVGNFTSVKGYGVITLQIFSLFSIF